MIIKINGTPIHESYPLFEKQQCKINLEKCLPKSKKEMKRMKKLAMFLWSVSGSMLLKSQALAAEPHSTSMWEQMQPLWSVFQDMSMVLGGIFLFTGLLIFLFKRSIGKRVIMTAVVVIGGCYLIPSIIMIVAIIGSMMNGVLTNVFNDLHLENSVKVGGQ